MSSDPRPAIFGDSTASQSGPQLVARVTLTVSTTVTTIRAIVVFTEARCPGCRRLVMAVPGRVTLESRMVRDNTERSGRGRVVSCPRCKGLVEVVEHT